ncbi:MAG TPA: NAD(P)H-dependent oxidoreductase subunit E [Terriglobales bacterium]|nr:NAD(P)H-dependent oxidoreductase subunit E [Terriglobales bacterium]
MHPSHIDHVPELLNRFDNRRANLVPILQAIIDEYTYLPDEAMREVAVKLQVPVAEVMQAAHKLTDPNRVLEPVDV